MVMERSELLFVCVSVSRWNARSAIDDAKSFRILMRYQLLKARMHFVKMRDFLVVDITKRVPLCTYGTIESAFAPAHS